MFLGIGCAGKNNEGSSPAQNISSDGAPVQEVTATVTSQSVADAETQSTSVKGSDTMLPLAQAEAEEFMNEKKNGINPVEHAVAYDGITVIVNPANPILTLPLASFAASTMEASVTGRMLVERTR